MGTVESRILDLAIQHRSYSQTLETSYEMVDSQLQWPSIRREDDRFLAADIEEASQGLDGVNFHSRGVLAWLG
jgi:hypothetical protein